MEPTSLNSRTTLVSLTEAEELVVAIEARGEVTMQPGAAAAAAKTLMGLFPVKAFNNAEVFATGLTALLAAYDPEFVRAICSPVDGLATRLKYALSLADVKEALEVERSKRLALLSRARWTVKEHARRKAEDDEKNFKLSPEEEAERKRRVDALLDKWRSAIPADWKWGKVDANSPGE